MVVCQECTEAMIIWVTVLQAGGVGDKLIKLSWDRWIFNSLNVAVPPTFLLPSAGETAIWIVLEVVSGVWL